MRIGVLAVQGAVSEHIEILGKCGARGVPVKRKEDFKELQGLIIPGGESTTIGRLINTFKLDREIIKMAREGRPVYGTCAGMILMAAEIEGEKPHLKLMDISVLRNAYGRQSESFEADLRVSLWEDKPFKGVFIRAPLVVRAGPDVEILSRFEGKITAVRQGNLLATSFHPELTEDERFHRLLMETAAGKT